MTVGAVGQRRVAAKGAAEQVGEAVVAAAKGQAKEGYGVVSHGGEVTRNGLGLTRSSRPGTGGRRRPSHRRPASKTRPPLPPQRLRQARARVRCGRTPPRPRRPAHPRSPGFVPLAAARRGSRPRSPQGPPAQSPTRPPRAAVPVPSGGSSSRPCLDDPIPRGGPRAPPRDPCVRSAPGCATVGAGSATGRQSPPATARPSARTAPPPIPRRLSLIHISEPTRRTPISYAVFCLKK